MDRPDEKGPADTHGDPGSALIRARQWAESVKGTPRHADSVVMPAFAEPQAVVRLRMLHRCLMCHKHCLIPCKFTAIEFQELLRNESESSDHDVERPGDGM